ncbi:MAG: ABC transporter substrate binding protein [Desulfomonilia bacterium]
MRRALLAGLSIVLLSLPCFARDTVHVEVLQVSKINPFDWTYEGFVKELAKHGLVEGKNLVINRHVIDADAEAGLIKKIGILLKIKNKASEIVAAKPDLVLTISTPATKYAKDAFISAGIPVVFSAVSVPSSVGCKSLTEAGPGFTGASLRIDPEVALKLTRHALPQATVMGIVHTDDDSAEAFVEDLKGAAQSAGMTILTRKVARSDSIVPAAEELIAQGAQVFGLPIDPYYAVKDYVHAMEFKEVLSKAKIPCICYCHVGLSGAILYIGSEFGVIGELSGSQAAKILIEGAKPETLPVLYQNELKILADEGMIRDLGIEMPLDLLELSRKVDSERH